jgi:hypothetical protein
MCLLVTEREMIVEGMKMSLSFLSYEVVLLISMDDSTPTV